VPTQTTLVTPNESTFETVAPGDTALLVATVTANGSPVTEGSVTFYEGWVPLGSAILQADGTAKLRVWLPPAINSGITARFNGSNKGAPSLTQTLGHVNQQAKSSVSLAASGSSPYTLEATQTRNDTGFTNTDIFFGAAEFKDTTTNTVLGVGPLARKSVESS